MPRSERPAEDAGDDTYQLDVVVSLFAILLVILVALAAARSAAESRVLVTWEAAAEGEPRFMPRSIQTPYGFHEVWGADAAGLFEIDRRAAVRAMADQSPDAPAGHSGPGADIFLDTFPDDPLGWRLRVNLHDRAAAGWIKARSIAWDDEAALAAWSAEERPVVVVVWASGHAHLPLLSRLLRRDMRPHRIEPFTDDVALVSIDYARANFAHAKVLRPY